eukprot:1158006-Pelagomonas_calceolata.AAC.16
MKSSMGHIPEAHASPHTIMHARTKHAHASPPPHTHTHTPVAAGYGSPAGAACPQLCVGRLSGLIAVPP